jgi:hypothetical protein
MYTLLEKKLELKVIEEKRLRDKLDIEEKYLKEKDKREKDKLEIKEKYLKEKLELERRKLDMIEIAEKRKYEQNITINGNNNTQNNIIIMTPPDPNIMPFNYNTSKEIIEIFDEMLFCKFSDIIGGPESSRDRKLISLIGWAHNNGTLPQFKNITTHNGKFYIPKNDTWLEITYPEIRDIVLHETIHIISKRKAECLEKSYEDIHGPNIYKRMRFALVTCIDILMPEKNIKQCETTIRNLIDVALKPDFDVFEYTTCNRDTDYKIQQLEIDQKTQQLETAYKTPHMHFNY